MKYFNVNLEFDHSVLEKTVLEVANSSKGYCCFVDLTSLVHSYNNPDFREVLNASLVNSCDGSYIAMTASKIYKKNLIQYIGPDFFEKFLYKKGSHLILGSTEEVYEKIVHRLTRNGSNDSNISYLSVPFKDVNEFDYDQIASVINKREPNYIWVSLGAPKQEIFMNKLFPHIDKGVLLGVGAALNYFSGTIKEIPEWTKKMHVVWVYRLLTEPKKQIKRLKTIFLTFPKMIKEEKKRVRNENS